MKLFNRHKKQVLENNYQQAKSELSPKAKREVSQRVREHFAVVNKFERDRLLGFLPNSRKIYGKFLQNSEG